jgi:hypothetical protein
MILPVIEDEDLRTHGKLTNEQKKQGIIDLQNALNRSNMDDKKNEIKKELYRQKEDAHLEYINKEGAHYSCLLVDIGFVWFTVPTNDMGDAKFHTTMPSQSLIRWMIEQNTNPDADVYPTFGL